MKAGALFLFGCAWLLANTNAMPAANADSATARQSSQTNADSTRASTQASGIRIHSAVACAQNDGNGIVIAFAPENFPFDDGTKTRQAIDALWKRIDRPDCQTKTVVFTSSATDISKCSAGDFRLLMNAESIACLQHQDVPYAFRDRGRAGFTTTIDQQGRLVHGPGWVVDTYHNTALDAK